MFSDGTDRCLTEHGVEYWPRLPIRGFSNAREAGNFINSIIFSWNLTQFAAILTTNVAE